MAGHRIATPFAPENSLSALRAAILLGVDVVETDVRLTADGVVVLIHDGSVERTLEGSGDVDQLTLAELQSLPMKVVGKDAKLLRGPDGDDLYYDTVSLTLGGGESYDVIIDTDGVAPGRYFLYTTNLYNLSNNLEDFGGQMTEIVIN